MCFILNMASKSPAPIVPWDDAFPGLWTERPKDFDAAELRSKFSLEHITYVGSSNRCGCNFRHNTFQQGGWNDDYLVEEPDYDPAPEEADHRALVAFLEKHFVAEGQLELFGAWGGVWNTNVEGRFEIGLDQILDQKFHFKEQVLYKVYLSKLEVAV
jgi:hypothetical protein